MNQNFDDKASENDNADREEEDCDLQQDHEYVSENMETNTSDFRDGVKICQICNIEYNIGETCFECSEDFHSECVNACL